jgi:tetratricopeptide (TPR) repeat protein
MASLLLPIVGTRVGNSQSRSTENQVKQSSKTPSSTSNVPASPNPKQLTGPPEKTSDDIEVLKQEISSLKNEQQQRVLDRANSTVDFANNVIQWSALFLTAFAIIFALAGFLGLREVQSIRRRSHEIEGLKDQFVTHLHNVEQLEIRIETHLRELSDKFARDSQTFIEASYFFNTATLAYKEGDNQKAIEYYGRALDLQPSNTRLFCRIGRSYTNLGDFQAAIDAFGKVLTKEPQNTEALRGMAAAYRYTDLDSSIEFARRATDADPNDYESLDYLGLLYRDRMQIDQAIEAHQRSSKLHPRPETDFFLSLLFVKKKDIERAKLMMQSANVGLRDAQAADRVRPLWAAVLRCGKSILENRPEDLQHSLAEVHDYVTTVRAAESVLSHFKFLFDALERQDELPTVFRAAIPETLMPIDASEMLPGSKSVERIEENVPESPTSQSVGPSTDAAAGAPSEEVDSKIGGSPSTP